MRSLALSSHARERASVESMISEGALIELPLMVARDMTRSLLFIDQHVTEPFLTASSGAASTCRISIVYTMLHTHASLNDITG